MKVITNIISSNYISKVGKYVVELCIRGETKKNVWLTEKQMMNLKNCFNETPKGYSTGDVSVIGVFNEKGYYAYSKVIKHKRKRCFSIPKEYNLNDLIDED